MDRQLASVGMHRNILRNTTIVKAIRDHSIMADCHATIPRWDCVLHLETLQCQMSTENIREQVLQQNHNANWWALSRIIPYTAIPFYRCVKPDFSTQSAHNHCIYTAYGIHMSLCGTCIQPNIQNRGVRVE